MDCHEVGTRPCHRFSIISRVSLGPARFKMTSHIHPHPTPHTPAMRKVEPGKAWPPFPVPGGRRMLRKCSFLSPPWFHPSLSFLCLLHFLLVFHNCPLFDIWCSYEFPGAAITKVHKLGGLKQQKQIFSPSWRTEVPNQDMSKGHVPPEVSRGGSFPASPQHLLITSNP